jgi:D-arabinose 1-dehydrogenase-like Zn-dependent alcohol dehydrogenase
MADENVDRSADAFFWEVYHVHSTIVASKATHQDSLEFAARHCIKPAIQLYELKGPETIEKVFADLKANRVRYRAVLKL